VRSLFLFLLTLSFNLWGADIQIPALNSPVMDEAKFLSQAEAADLGKLAYEIHANQGPQITIFTVPDMQGYEIEDFSIRVAEKWKLGTKENGNGLLIIIAKQERKMRIEVGQGIEGEITDFEANRYIRSVLTPYFKQSQFHDGLKIVLLDVAQKFNIKLSEGSSIVRRAPRARARALPAGLVTAFPFLIGLLILGQVLLGKKPVARGLFTGAGLAATGFFIGTNGIVMIGFMFLMGLFIGIIGIHNLLFAVAAGGSQRGYRGGGGGFGGGSGGGGWSGGGGGFSGGGSSGSW